MNIRPLYYLLLGLLLVAALSGGVTLLVRRSNNPGIEILLPTATPTPELKVYVSGAVNREGVYSLKQGDRVEQALAAAGGAAESADLSPINLAQRLRDQDHIHVPKVGETIPLTTTPSPTSDSRRIDINTASAQLLDSLPGVGPTRASAIVRYREEHGDYCSTEQVMQVEGIGQGIYGQIRDLITVGRGCE